MHKARVNRIKLFALYFVCFCVGLGCLLFFFHGNIIYFITPKEIGNYSSVQLKSTFKLGGYITAVEKVDGGVKFVVTDFEKEVPVEYKGMVPNLFKEGQATVATGFMREDGVFVAAEILAKHDENYIPSEVMGVGS